MLFEKVCNNLCSKYWKSNGMSVVWITQKHTKKKTKKRRNKNTKKQQWSKKQTNNQTINEETKKQKKKQIKQKNEKTKKQRNMPIWHHPFHHGTHFLFNMYFFFDLHRSGGGAFIGNRSEFCSCDLAFSSESDDQIIPLLCFFGFNHPFLGD